MREDLDRERSKLKSSEDNYDTVNQLVCDLNTNVKALRKHTTEAMMAMIDAGLPTKRKHDIDVPAYLEVESYSKQHTVPWNVEAKRAFTPAEGIQLLALKLKESRMDTKESKKK